MGRKDGFIAWYTKWHWVQLSQFTWYLVTMRVFFRVSVGNLAAMQADVVFIVHVKDSAFTTESI